MLNVYWVAKMLKVAVKARYNPCPFSYSQMMASGTHDNLGGFVGGMTVLCQGGTQVWEFTLSIF